MILAYERFNRPIKEVSRDLKKKGFSDHFQTKTERICMQIKEDLIVNFSITDGESSAPLFLKIKIRSDSKDDLIKDIVDPIAEFIDETFGAE